MCQTEYTFKVPILSVFFGILAPENLGLIDGNLLGYLQFEWTFNQYAFYTTGAKPSASNKFDLAPATDLFARSYTFSSVSMVYDTYHPINISHKAIAPISYFTQGWNLGVEYDFNNTGEL